MKKIAILLTAIVFFTTVFAAPALAQDDEISYTDVQMNYTLAIKAMKGKDWKAAVKHWKFQTDYDKHYGQGWASMGDCYMNLRSYKNAAACYKNAKASKHVTPSTLINWSRALGELGQVAEAAALLKSIKPEDFKTDSEKITFYKSMAGTAYKNKDYGKALGFYKKAFAVERNSETAYMAGACSEQLNDLDGAIKYHGLAFSLNSKNSNAGYRLVNSLLKRARINKSKADYDQSAKASATLVKNNPGKTKYLKVLGESQIGQKNFDSAITTLKKVLAADPGDCITRHNLGRTYSFKKDYAQAITVLKEAIKCKGSDYQVWRDLGWAYENLGKSKDNDLKTFETAKSHYDKANALKRGSTTKYINRLAALITNAEIESGKTDEDIRIAELRAEKAKLIKLIKIGEISRSDSPVGGKIYTHIFATVTNSSKKNMNITVEAIFYDAANRKIKSVSDTLKGMTPGKSSTLDLETSGVENAKDYKVRIKDIRF